MMESKIDFDALKAKRHCETPPFLKKLHSLFKLLDGIIICTVDIAGWHPKIPHEDDFSSLHKRLESWKEKYISTNILLESADLVLKTTFLNSEKNSLTKTRNSNRYEICIELEDKISKKATYKACFWWRCIDDIFSFGNTRKVNWKSLLNILIKLILL